MISVITTVAGFVLSGVGAISVIMLVWAGFRYITSGGESGIVTSAKNTVIYATTGIVGAVLLYVVTNFIASRVDSSDPVAATESSKPIFFGLAAVGLFAGLFAGFRRSSRILGRILHVVVGVASLWLPREERNIYREQMRAMLLQAQALERLNYVFDMLTRSPAMGIRRRWAIRAE